MKELPEKTHGVWLGNNELDSVIITNKSIRITERDTNYYSIDNVKLDDNLLIRGQYILRCSKDTIYEKIIAKKADTLCTVVDDEEIYELSDTTIMRMIDKKNFLVSYNHNRAGWELMLMKIDRDKISFRNLEEKELHKLKSDGIPVRTDTIRNGKVSYDIYITDNLTTGDIKKFIKKGGFSSVVFKLSIKDKIIDEH